MRRFLAFSLTLTLVACGAEGPRSSSTAAPAAGIVGGKTVSQVDAAVAATVSLHQVLQDMGTYCTGTLIDRRFVLTAAHCVEDFPAADLAVGFAAEPETKIGIETIVAHEEFIAANRTVRRIGKDVYSTNSRHDIALIYLKQDAPAKAIPAAIQTVAIAPGKRQQVRLLGYGSTGWQKQDQGTLRQTTIVGTVPKDRPDKLLYNQASGRGLCHGDSGGPSFIVTRTGVTLVAVSAHLDGLRIRRNEVVGDACRRKAIATQVAPYVSWIERKKNDLLSAGGSR